MPAATNADVNTGYLHAHRDQQHQHQHQQQQQQQQRDVMGRGVGGAAKELEEEGVTVYL